MTSNRILLFDYARGFAIVCVVLMHTTLSYAYVQRDIIIDIFLHNLVIVGVPLFFFISGYMLALNAHPHFGSYLKTRVIRIYLPAAFWIALLSLFFGLVGETQDFSISELLGNLIVMNASVQFYFILVILFFYIVGFWLVKLNDLWLKRATQIAFILNLITIAAYEIALWTSTEATALDGVWMYRNPLAWIFFFVFGIYICRSDRQLTGGLFHWLGRQRVLGIGLVLGLWIVTSLESVALYDRFLPGGQDYFKVASFFYEILALVYVLNFFKRYEGRATKPLLVLAHYSFFIFLLHVPLPTKLLGERILIPLNQNYHYISLILLFALGIVIPLLFAIPMRFLRLLPRLHNLVATVTGWPTTIQPEKPATSPEPDNTQDVRPSHA